MLVERTKEDIVCRLMIAYEPFFAHSRFVLSPRDPHDNISASPPLACSPVKASALRRSAYIELLTSWFDRSYLTWMRKPRWRIVSQACSRSQRDRNLIPTGCRNVKNPWYCFTSKEDNVRAQNSSSFHTVAM